MDKLLEEFIKDWRLKNNSKDAIYSSYHYDAMIKFAKHYHSQQLILSGVSQRSELLPDFLYKDDFGIKIGYHGDTEVSEEWNDYLKKLGNCG